MILKLLLPVLAGVSIVLQGTLNKNSAQQIGLASAVFLNALVFLVVSAVLWLFIKYNGVNFFGAAKSLADLKWWQYLPGILGFVIVLSTPLAIHYLGANLTFAVIICTQLAVSLLWDVAVTRTAPSITSLAGLTVMYAGLFILLRGSR